jgi:hypothetical protein
MKNKMSEIYSDIILARISFKEHWAQDFLMIFDKDYLDRAIAQAVSR